MSPKLVGMGGQTEVSGKSYGSSQRYSTGRILSYLEVSLCSIQSCSCFGEHHHIMEGDLYSKSVDLNVSLIQEEPQPAERS